MILVDISSILHRMIFGSTKDASNIRKKDGKYITEDFVFLTMHYILSELVDIQTKYRGYGEMVICFDDYKKAYWRRDSYPEYKASRRDKSGKDENPINYQELFEYTNKLFEEIKNNTPWKCIYVSRAEADDIILVLAKEYHQEGILILSPDKDFLQAQRLPGVKQYSALTRKWLVPENKHDNMQQWIMEHVLLGDASDGVPKIVDHTEFSDAFKEHILKSGFPENVLEVYEFKKLPIQDKRKILENYDVKKYNRKGQDIGFDIYKDMRFGASNIEKIISGKWSLKIKQDNLKDKIKLEQDKDKKKLLRAELKNLTIDEKTEKERLDEFLDSHPLYKEHYNRNFEMVMEEGIPDYIRANILMEYKSANVSYNQDEFNKFLDENKLHTIKSKLPLVFSPTETITTTNCGWDF